MSKEEDVNPLNQSLMPQVKFDRKKNGAWGGGGVWIWDESFLVKETVWKPNNNILNAADELRVTTAGMKGKDGFLKGE